MISPLTAGSVQNLPSHISVYLEYFRYGMEYNMLYSSRKLCLTKVEFQRAENGEAVVVEYWPKSTKHISYDTYWLSMKQYNAVCPGGWRLWTNKPMLHESKNAKWEVPDEQSG